MSFFFISFFKDSKTPQTSFLMLKANKTNLRLTPKLSSIKLTWPNGFVTYSPNFKNIVMANYNALKSNQWLLDWFKSQALTTKAKESTIIFKICEIKRSSILLLILTIFCLLFCKRIITSLSCRASWNIMILRTNLQPKL